METIKRLPESELEVMLAIWDGGERISTSEILRRLGKNCKCQQVQSYLTRLEEKGFVRCEKLGRLNHYTALVPLEEYRARETASFVGRLYRNSPVKLFATLLETTEIAPEELEELRRMLEEVE